MLESGSLRQNKNSPILVAGAHSGGGFRVTCNTQWGANPKKKPSRWGEGLVVLVPRYWAAASSFFTARLLKRTDSALRAVSSASPLPATFSRA